MPLYDNWLTPKTGAGAGIKATPAVTGKVTPKVTAKVTPKVTGKTTGTTTKTTGATTTTKGTTPTTKTGDQLQQAVNPAKLTPGLTDQLTLNQIESENKASEALRMYQAQAAQQQLQNSLATINRSAIQQYEGIANDYASRGMLQSGSYAVDTNRAQADVNDQTVAAQTAVRDFLNQNNLQSTVAKGAKQGSLQDILVRLLTEFNTNNINQLGQ
jgi:hypothetical protein